MQQGDYMTEIRDSFELRTITSKITKNLDLLEGDCMEFIKKFSHFSSLFKQDPEDAFEIFLKEQ
jgi:hypothetical protein